MAAYTRAAPREGRGAGSRSRIVRLPLQTLAAGRGGAAAVRPRRVRARQRGTASSSLRAPGTPGLHVLPVQRAPFAFDLLGARWRARAGSTVEVRTRAAAAPWSAWTRLEPDGSGAVSHAEPVWLPGSGRLQVRVRGVSRVRIALVASRSQPAAAAARPLLGSRPAVDHLARRAGARTRRCGVRHRATPRPCTWSSCTTRTRPTATRPTTCRRSSVRSTPTTCARTAGTTLATTSSSTPTGASSRVAPAASTAPSSARTRRASTPAAWASP